MMHLTRDTMSVLRGVRVFSTKAVGKSAILLQFTERQFRDAHDMTIGVEFGAKDVSIGDAQVRCMSVCMYYILRM